MEPKTKVSAQPGRHDLVITREFDLPLELLFKAYSEADLFQQWMNTRLVKFECKKHGCYQFETSDPKGNVVFRANGTIHEFIENQKITRTFEMENTPFPVQIEYLEFEKINDDKSRLMMQIVYRSPEFRDQMLQMPFAQGINMAHNRLQEIINQLKK